MSTLPFDKNLNWVERNPLRKPVRTSPCAQTGLSEWLQEVHEELSHAELTKAILTIEDAS